MGIKLYILNNFKIPVSKREYFQNIFFYLQQVPYTVFIKIKINFIYF